MAVLVAVDTGAAAVVSAAAGRIWVDDTFLALAIVDCEVEEEEEEEEEAEEEEESLRGLLLELFW